MYVKYDFILSEDDRSVLLLALREFRRNKQQVFEAGFYSEHVSSSVRFTIDSLDRILEILEMSGELMES